MDLFEEMKVFKPVDLEELEKKLDQSLSNETTETLNKFLDEQRQICYKTNKPCKYDCKGLCKESC